MKKKAALFFVFCLVALSVFAGGNEESSENPVLELAAMDNIYGISTDPELQQSISDMIEEKTGVKISPIIPPLASYQDKIATLVNSGDIPDVFNVQ